jgi:hypothetical protein
MSYSRWSNSIWYTFWTSASPQCDFRWPTKQLRDSQLFEICGIPSYTISYGEIIEKGIPVILREVHDYYNQTHACSLLDGWDEQRKPLYSPTTILAQSFTESELQELGEYIAQFASDVEHNFQYINFIKKYWWHVIRYTLFNRYKYKLRHIYNKRTI